MNQQPIEKLTHNQRGMLQVHSIFHTIQGEGPFAGCPALFVRLAGCNLQCPLCDTDYTSERKMVGPMGLVELLWEFGAKTKLVVITGGEPFRQNLTPAVEALFAAGFEVQIETNGTAYLAGFPYAKVTTVVSPKAGTINRQLADHDGAISALKYVAQAGQMAEDGLPVLALGHSASPMVARPPAGYTGPIYLQPADEKDPEANQKNLDAVVASCKKHNYILGIQIHKMIGEE